MGEGFSADAEKLQTGARVHLGNQVEKLKSAHQTIGSTDEHDAAFTGGEGLFDGVGDRWKEARHYLERVLADNAENVELSKDALIEIGRRYEHADREAARGVDGGGAR